MNLFGHNFVAYKTTGRMNRYLTAGSLVPDIAPFVPNAPFSFEEIHESGDKLYEFLRQNYPEKSDLGVGIMAHSVKYGADKFNREIEGWLLKGDENLAQEIAGKIADCSGVNLEVARGPRLHNYLWCGVDIFLLKNQPNFIAELTRCWREIDRREIAVLLTEGFNGLRVKDKKRGKKIISMKEVERAIDCLFEKINPELFGSVEGIAKIWKEFLADLPEKDCVDVTKTVKVFENIYQRFEGRWENVMTRVVESTKENLLR